VPADVGVETLGKFRPGWTEEHVIRIRIQALAAVHPAVHQLSPVV
jgi:hypothetical protein